MSAIRKTVLEAAEKRDPRTVLLEIADVVGELVGAEDPTGRASTWCEFVAIVDAAAADTHEQRKSA